MSKAKIVLFNLVYSDNLGDELIAKCLENSLRDRTKSEVISLDLSGRLARGSILKRVLVLNIIQTMPRFLRRLIVRLGLSYRMTTILKRWVLELKDANVAIIGGGHLFQDNDLNFPLKIATAAKAARIAKVPLIIFGVGVSSDWSYQAQRLFKSVQGNRILQISVRDCRSRVSLCKHFFDIQTPPIQVCRDPALLMKAGSNTCQSAKTIGIGIVHPSLLSYHATMPTIGGGSDARSFYIKTAILLMKRGYGVRFFTNGAQEDELFKDSLKKFGADIGATFERRPQSSEELIEMIGSFSGIMAHRLHANVIAFAYLTPHVGLAWDEKLTSFFRSVGRERYLIDDPEVAISEVVDKIIESLSDPFVIKRNQAIQEANNQVDAMIATILQDQRVYSP